MYISEDPRGVYYQNCFRFEDVVQFPELSGSKKQNYGGEIRHITLVFVYVRAILLSILTVYAMAETKYR